MTEDISWTDSLADGLYDEDEEWDDDESDFYDSDPDDYEWEREER